jgi:peptidoglycan/xylan/chitin deacetylase (PgdA/CDA1 family)
MPLTRRGFPLLLTFDLDGETMWTSRDPAAAKRPILMSQGAYGWKTGVPRILELLHRYDIRTTFLDPGNDRRAATEGNREHHRSRARDRAPQLLARLDRQPDA